MRRDKLSRQLSGQQILYSAGDPLRQQYTYSIESTWRVECRSHDYTALERAVVTTHRILCTGQGLS